MRLKCSRMDVAILVILLVLLGMVWAAQGEDFILTNCFRTNQDDYRWDTVDDAIIREVKELESEYMKAARNRDLEGMKQLIPMILRRAAQIEECRLPEPQQEFLNGIRDVDYDGRLYGR